MERRKIIGVAVFSAAIAGGGVAGVVLGSPATSSAATSSGSPTTTSPGRPSWGGRRGQGRGFGMGFALGFRQGVGLDTAAKAIGVSTQTLLGDLQGGQTIAQVATAKGVAVTTVVNALVASTKTQIAAAVKAGHLSSDQATKIESRLTQMITAEVNGSFRRPFAGGGPGGGPQRGFGTRGGFGLDAAATAIGVSEQTLLSDMKGGQTIAQVAKAKGVPLDTVIAAMVASAKSQFAAAVKAGHLSADQASKIEANLTTMITNLVNGKLPHPMGHGGPGGFGRFGGPGGPGGQGATGGYGGFGGGPPSTPTSAAPTV